MAQKILAHRLAVLPCDVLRAVVRHVDDAQAALAFLETRSTGRSLSLFFTSIDMSGAKENRWTIAIRRELMKPIDISCKL